MRTNGGDFTLATIVINQLLCLQAIGLYVKEKLRDLQIDCWQYDHAYCIDKPENLRMALTELTDNKSFCRLWDWCE